ncbi:MAG: dual specificity protein phosphatase family protein [FCB group bacterium]|jgi:predicted protein tyrosine phosphatase
MIEIYTNLFIGTTQDCPITSTDDWTTIHACKDPCHRRAVNYRNNLPNSHSFYLIYKNNYDLYLNMVDMEQELMLKFTNPIMKAAMSFIEENITDKKILIHCNQGQSRSPSIAMIYLARIRFISNNKFENTVQDFINIFPNYNPGTGIKLYMKKNWDTIINNL